ncbi:hypothetical protein GCM10009642_66050 [Nocardiopsis metallicus]
MVEMRSSDHIDDKLMFEIERQVANSTLLLSDESIGGGMDYLPEDIVEAAGGPPDSMLPYGTTPLKELDVLLSSANTNIQGGTEISASITATVSRVIAGLLQSRG